MINNGYAIAEDGKTLAIGRGNRSLSEEIKYIKSKKIRSISINSDSIKDLSFLKDITFIEEIYLNKFDIDCSGLYELNNLKKITVNIHDSQSKPSIDYSQFKELEHLSIDWYNEQIDLSENIHLKTLVIWKFKPKNKSFSFIKLPGSLEKIHITESNIQNFEGLKLSKLKIFEGHYCSQLSTLKGLENICENLEILILDYCRKLIQYNELKNCLNLEKLILGDCGDIPDLKWIKLLKKLKHFSFYNTKLMDGNVNPCFGIQYVSFKDNKNYNHRIEEFRNQ
ncbi:MULTISPECIES: hypothetical protein [unclassified Chryseobacterium]|uniref:hypothetical protein n=1 Tax=unclassified Chryseobacterium TaxID=2593645 RepID=UPI001AE93F95|nr:MULTISPECIES: hypothetical protein [unclassified Chryseobacterium]MBP1165007.1 hypothetical protein [Chryseobacterium sp. PvR013]MDR4891010.1 hypothetical protein [Chryseobacterium sp. CFS7]